MGMCPACAAPTEPGDRFCSACGHALVEPVPGGEVSDDSCAVGSALHEPELILVAPRTAAQPPPDRPGRRRPRPWMGLAVAAAVLVVALAVWAIGRAGGDQTRSAAPDPTDAANPTGRTTAGSTLTGVGTEPGPSATDGPEPAVTAITTDTASGASPAGSGGPAGDGPVLGRPTGWSLLIGSTFDNDTITRLDLDTGRQSALTGVLGGPLAVVDGALIMLRSAGSGLILRILPLDQLAADGIDIEVTDGLLTSSWPVAPGGEGRLWVYTSIGEVTAWQLIRLEDGRSLQEIPTVSMFESPPVTGAGPDVVGSRGGSVYRREGDGYRLVGPGAPLAANGGDVLTRNCSAPTVCPMQWLDLETGRPVDRPVPPADPGVYWGRFESTGRFLIGGRPAPPDGRFAEELMIHDLESGRTVTTDSSLNGGGFAASPDGRLLAVQADDGLRLYDVDGERWVEVDGPGGGEATLVFVPDGAMR